MLFEAFESNPPDAWDRIAACVGGTHFHTASWAHYRSRLEGVIPVFFLAREPQGEPLAVSIGYLEGSKRLGLRSLTRRLALQSHPAEVALSDDDRSAFLCHLQEYASRNGCATLTIESFFSGTSRFQLSRHGFSESRRIEFHLDLREARDSIWKKVSREQREKIRRAEREGVTVRLTNNYDGLLSLRTLEMATRERRDEMGQGYELDSDEARYRVIFDTLGAGGLMDLFVAYLEDRPISAILFAAFNGRAYSVFSASDAPGYKLSASSLIFWKAVERFHQQGYELLNRGGVAYESREEGHPAHGIYFYKSRLGTEAIPCSGGTKTLRPVQASISRYITTAAAGWRRH